MLKVLMFILPILASAYPKSDHYDGKIFHNLDGNKLHSFWEVMKWKITADPKKWLESVPNRTFPAPVLAPGSRATATFINHSTYLLQYPGLNVLTDPQFSVRASPSQLVGPKRVREPGLKVDDLPPIDVVLVSHNHYDHLDLDSLKTLDSKFHPLFIVPLGDEKLLKEAGIQNVLEMDWWQEHKIKDVSIYFTPSQHWSARGLFDKCESLWGSFMIVTPTFKTYFAGDTGYAAHFKMTRARYGEPDLALLPIGAYSPQWFMTFNHMNPEEALKAHVDLGAKESLAMHFGTFQLSDEGMEEPVEDLKKAKEKLGPEASNFLVIDQGESKVY